MEMEAATCIPFDDQNRNRRVKAKYEKDETKVAAIWDSAHPCVESVEFFIEAARREIRVLGVRCDKNLICGDSVHDPSEFGAFRFGGPLLDVYSVTITIKDREKIPGQRLRVRGAIRLYNTYNTIYPHDELLYDVKKDDPAQYIHLDHEGSATLLLSGPKTALACTETRLALTFALKLEEEENVFQRPADADGYPFSWRFISYAVENDTFDAATILFDPLYTSGRWHNSEHSQLLWGLYAANDDPEKEEDLSRIPVHVVVHYALLPYAVTAKVSVTFSGEENVDGVWGCIRARPCVLDKEIVLFDKEKTESVTVEPHSHSLKLTRSLVAVPYNASLIIEAQLHDSNGNPIVNDTSFFRACAAGTFYTTFGTVKFEVAWSELPR